VARRRRRRSAFGRGLVALLVVVVSVAYGLWGPAIRGWLGGGGEVMAPTKGDDRLRVVTWNLRNFPGEKQDLERVRQRLRELDADVIAVQEIHNAEALIALMPGWELRLSEGGGRGHQRLGVLFDPGRVEIVGEPVEHRELALGGRVRPALSVYMRARGGGPDFHVVVVHLKARASGYEMRREQWPALAAVVEGLRRRDPDVIVVGDFNATGPEGQAAEVEIDALAAVLGPVGLRQVASEGGCSAYWDGPRRDAWQEPSLLDLMWVGGLDGAIDGESRAIALGHCARHHCAAFRSTEAYPDLDFTAVSDHCPVALDLRGGSGSGG